MEEFDQEEAVLEGPVARAGSTLLIRSLWSCSEWLPSVSMDPNGLDISEESDMKVPSRCLRSCCTFSNMACCADYMPFPIAPQLHHHTLHMGQHQHPHNTPLLQAVTQMHHQPQSSLGGMQHASGLDFMTQHGPVDPHQHLQSL